MNYESDVLIIGAGPSDATFANDGKYSESNFGNMFTASYAWGEKNPFVAQSERRLQTLFELCSA